MNLAFYGAIERIPLGIAVTLEFVGPLAVAILGSRRLLDFVWFGLSAARIALLAGAGEGSIHLLGVSLALLAGGFWASYIVLGARVGRIYPGPSGLAVAMSLAALLVAPAGIASGGSELLSGRVLIIGAAIGVLSSAIPWSLEIEALRRLPTHTFGVLMSLEPALAALAGLAILGPASWPCRAGCDRARGRGVRRCLMDRGRTFTKRTVIPRLAERPIRARGFRLFLRGRPASSSEAGGEPRRAPVAQDVAEHRRGARALRVELPPAPR
jgi:EamA-like transporter family